MAPEGADERIMAIDVGGGTQDILLFEPGQPMENCVKLVLPAQTVVVARRIAQATRARRPVHLAGSLMGGGSSVKALLRHVKEGLSATATTEAAKTIKDNPEHVLERGIGIMQQAPPDAVVIRTGDVDLTALADALARFEVMLPSRYAVAVQDHGECLTGSNRRFRFALWERFLSRGARLMDLVYRDDVPAELTRMKAVQKDLPGAVVTDTSTAAILGALEDPAVAVAARQGAVIVNAGNKHTTGLLIEGDRVWGLFEHHTSLMDPAKLADHVVRLSSGSLDGEEVFRDQGHGAWVHPDAPVGTFEFVAVTGPQRHLAADLGWHLATPHGDMMLSGAFGLVAAARALFGDQRA